MQSFLLHFALPCALAATAAAQSQHVAAGPLRFDVHISRTAHLFHVVDQVSEWSPFCHTQYQAALFPLSDEDEELLAEHAAIRERRGWGGGLEQTLYSELELEEALVHGVEEGWIDAEEAQVEARVLEHFAERVERLIESDRVIVEAFRDQIAEKLPQLEELAVRLELLFGEAPRVPVFLLANPSADRFGGGYNGGRLTIEVPRASDAYGTFLHELTHVYVNLRREEIERAAQGAPLDEGAPFDYQTVNEGIAHALSPGVFHSFGDPAFDALAQRVRQFEGQGQTLADYSLRIHRYALALRPLVRTMLEDESVSFELFLERTVDVWHAMAELELVRLPEPR